MATKAMIRAVSEQEIAAYENDGVVCLRQIVDAGWLERLRAETERELADPGPLALDLTRGKQGKFFANTFVCHHRAGFLDFVRNGPGAAIAAQITRSASATLLFDQLLIKEPGTETPTLWHHDAPYWPVAGTQVATIWIALDAVTAESGAVEYVKGSHRWGRRFKARAFVDDGLYTDDLPAVPDIEAERDRHQFIQFELQPGDCTVHQALAVHGAPGNRRSDRRRRAYIQRWCGDDVTWDPRPNIQPMLRDPGLKPGDKLPCDLFPQIWPSDALRPA
jgi:ectoine hydroxylase-related dioxygenase (phytanoyl-CoA dioxygenase family)